jgi:hypothetical protein
MTPGTSTWGLETAIGVALPLCMRFFATHLELFAEDRIEVVRNGSQLHLAFRRGHQHRHGAAQVAP